MPVRFRAPAFASFVVALLVTSCGGSSSTTTTTTSPPSSSTTTTVTPSSTTEPPPSTTSVPATTTTEIPVVTSPIIEASTVNVYWGWTVPTTSSGTPERIAASVRSAEDTPEAALRALIAGPSEGEIDVGMSSGLAPETELHSVAVADGVATADLSAGFDTVGGTLAEAMLIAQVVFTLTQFDDIDLVKFSIDGTVVDVVGSHGIEVGDGLDRSSFGDVRPFILVESPGPWTEVEDPFVLRGEANTFEATVEWELLNWDGLIVSEGFTTATQGNGTWGTFEAQVDVPDDLRGPGTIIVFESSAQDGMPQNVVEYPVEFIESESEGE